MEKVWKNQKGITLVSLIVYLIGLVAIIGIVAVLTSFYSKNVATMNDTSEVNSEFNKFDAKMIQETKTAGNEITEVSGTTIKFKNGNTYTYGDNRIYQNAVTVSKYVKDFAVNFSQDGDKQILSVYVTFGKGKIEVAKSVSYVVEVDGSEFVGGLSNINPPETPEVDSNGLAVKNTTIKPKADSNLQIVIPAGFAPAILQTGWTQSLPGQDGSVKEIMPAEKWNSITIEDINKGVVVVDGDGNEFVWVPIEDSSKFARVAWTTPYGFDVDGNRKDVATLHLLADIMQKGYYWENKNAAEYNQMVNSVTYNKGFLIGRYEVSDKGTIKREQNVWNNIVLQDAINASNSYNSVLHSHLTYGIEWDSVLNWTISNAIISTSTSGQNHQMELEDIQTNSSSWGNYSDSIGNAALNSGGTAPQTTGKSEYWKANNVYDLAGNVWEWTQEKWSENSNGIVRGGCYKYASSSLDAVASRYYMENASSKSDRIGFRICLFI